MKKYVLGVKIDDINMSEALQIVERWVHNGGKHYIVTPNPEFLVAAQKDIAFKEALNKANLAIPDGVGLKLLGVKNRVSGVDLMEKIIELSVEKGFVISFLGGSKGVAESLVERLKRRYQNISVAFAGSGGRVNKDGELDNSEDFKIPPSDILFVAFGPPKQEKWIAKNLDKIPVNVMMGVGGSFDFLSGKTIRAPRWVRSLGLEWLFRLVLQPWRIRRQLALIQYLLLVLKERFRLYSNPNKAN